MNEVSDAATDSSQMDAGEDQADSAANTCPPAPPPLDDPNHSYRYVSVTALDDDVLVDAVGVRFFDVEACVVYADTVEDADLDPNDLRATELLGEPDATVDGMCNEDLAHPLFRTANSVRVIIPAAIREGDTVEIHEVRGCQDPDRAPQFEVRVHQGPFEPGRVVGTGAGPIAAFELPPGFYD